ncbi:MAG: hypothetical protein ACOCQ3_04625 [Natronomonas sp.]
MDRKPFHPGPLKNHDTLPIFVHCSVSPVETPEFHFLVDDVALRVDFGIPGEVVFDENVAGRIRTTVGLLVAVPRVEGVSESLQKALTGL